MTGNENSQAELALDIEGQQRATATDLGDESENVLPRRDTVGRFDVRRLSMRPSTNDYSLEGQSNAVNVTRTLSLSRKEWDALLAKPELALHHENSVPSFAASTASQSSQINGKRQQRFYSIFGLPILHPHGRFTIFWHGKMLILDLTYTAFIVPIGVGFNISDTSWTWGAVCDFSAGLVFLVDFILGFHTGYVCSYNVRKKVVMDGKQVAKWYVTRGSCIVDFFSTVAWITQAILIILRLAGQDDGNIASQIQILRILRLARLARLFKSIFMSATGGGGIAALIFKDPKMDSTALYFLQLLYAIAVLINFLGCFWYWVADREGINETWITAFGPYIARYGDENGLDAALVRERISKPNLYMTSIYWALMTVSTIGYGDITAQTVAEEVVSLFVFLLGIIFFGVLVGSLTQLLQTASRDARKAQSYREKMNVVDDWIKRRHFNTSLRKKIREHYWAFWLRQADEADEMVLLQELPHALRHEALWYMSKRSLMVLPAFSDLPKELQYLLASHIRPRKIAPGTDITCQGAAASKMYLLDYGKVVPVHQDVAGAPHTEPLMLNADGMLQELSPKFQRYTRGFRSVTPCGVWEWPLPAFLGLCRNHAGVFEHICEQVIAGSKGQFQAEPDLFPEGFAEALQEAETKLQIRLSNLERSSAEKADQPQYADFMSASGATARIFSGRSLQSSDSQATFKAGAKAMQNQTESASVEENEFPSARTTYEDIGDPTEAEEEEAEAEDNSMPVNIAASLSEINDQLAELRNLILSNRD